MSAVDADQLFTDEDVLSFSEDLLDTYDSSVHDYFAEVILLKHAQIKALALENRVTKTVGDPKRGWTKVTMIRDLMAAGVELASGARIDSAVIERKWLPEPVISVNTETAMVRRSGEDQEERNQGGGLFDQEIREEVRAGNPVVRHAAPSHVPPSPPADLSDAAALRKYLKARDEIIMSMQRTIETQQLEIVRIRTNKDTRREYGLGLSAMTLRPESLQLLWDVKANPFEQEPLKSVDYRELLRENSSTDLSARLHQRPGIGETEASYCNKVKEFSVKDVFDKFTRPMVHRIEPVVTTLLTAHSCALHSLECAEFLSGSSVQYVDSDGQTMEVILPSVVRDRVRQLEADAEMAHSRIEAAIVLLQSETARMCSDTQLAVAKKMSAGAAQQLQLSKVEEQTKTASMLTESFVKTLEEQRKQQKTINHALDAKSQQSRRGRGGRAGSRGGRAGRGSGRKPKPTKTSTKPQQPKAAATPTTSPSTQRGGRGAGKKD